MAVIDELKQEIIAKYGSIHAFCKNNQALTRATVYFVLNGKYAGKTQRQLEKIKAVLNNTQQWDIIQKNITINENEIFGALKQHKCNHCRLLKKNCVECTSKTEKEAQAVYSYISSVL